MRQWFVITLVLAGSAVAAPAEPLPLPECPARPIRFAYYEMGAVYRNGVGIDKDMVDALQQRSGCAFAAAVQPRARTWVELERGSLDMAGSALHTPERDRFVQYVDYFADKNRLLLRTEVAPTVVSLDTLLADPRLRLGIVRSFVHGPLIDGYVARLRSQGRLEEVEDQETLYRMLAARRFDAVLGYPYVYSYYLQKYGVQDTTRVQNLDALASAKVALVLAQKSFSPAQPQRWQALVNRMRDDGTLFAIFQKHVGAAEARAMVKY